MVVQKGFRHQTSHGRKGSQAVVIERQDGILSLGSCRLRYGGQVAGGRGAYSRAYETQ